MSVLYGYTYAPTHLRIFWEGYQWSMDGANDTGDYTELCWSADTHAGVVALIPEFIEAAKESGIKFKFRTGRRPQKITYKP